MGWSLIDQFGSTGAGDGELDNPFGVARDADYIYVVEFGNNRVQIFDKTTYAFVGKFGTAGAGDGQFTNPWGIAVDATYIYVGDRGNNRIQVFNKATYAFAYKFTVNFAPIGLVLDEGYTYVLNYAGHKVAKYSGAAFVNEFGSQGSGDGQFNFPRGLALDVNYIYVAGYNNNRVQIFDKTTYAFVGKFGTLGAGDGQFNLPEGVVVDADYIYVADRNNNRVQVFNKTSPYAFVEKFSSAGCTGIALEGSLLYVTDNVNDTVSIYTKPPPTDPTNLTALCQIASPVSPSFTADKTSDATVMIEGLLTVTNGSADVSGFGTKFTEDLIPGDTIVLNNVVYEVQSITDDTHLVLTSIYAGASASRIESWKPVTISFTNTTVVVGTATYFWDFGDGTFSSEENPTHTYTGKGTYAATLKVYEQPPLTGSVSLVNGSNVVEGLGTSFTTEAEAGESIILNGVSYTIQSVTDNDTLVLTEVYSGFSASGVVVIKRTSLLTGTISVTNGSDIVTGSGTSFTTDLARGKSIEIEGIAYVIDEVVSDTELRLMNAYSGATAGGLPLYKRLSRFDGAYSSNSTEQTLMISDQGPLVLDYLKGNFETSILQLTDLTGTVDVTNGSNHLLGVGTSFLSELESLEQITIKGVLYTIYSITNDTDITLTTTYAGTTDTGVDFYQKSFAAAGTISVTNESNVVLGSLSSFLTDYDTGKTITIEGVDYLIEDVSSDLELILSETYAGSADSGLNHFKGSSSYTNVGVSPILLNLLDGTLGEVGEYLWDLGDGILVAKTGTISATQGQKVITGSGTLFTSELTEGLSLSIEGGLYKILNIVSDTELLLASYYAGATQSGLSYNQRSAGTSSALASPTIYLDDARIYEITLEVIKNQTLYSTTKSIQVKALASSSEEGLGQFTAGMGDGTQQLTGTIGVKNGSKTVLGSATSFTTELSEGGYLTIAGVRYTIATIVNDEELTLTQVYGVGDTASIPLTGTMTLVQGSSLLSGIGTSFTTELIANQTITLDGVDYVVVEVIDDSNLRLTYPYLGESVSGLTATKEEGILTQGIAGYNGFTGDSQLTGTLSVTEGSVRVIGEGTSFTTEIVKNQELVIAGEIYTVLGILSDTELILTRVYAGSTDTNLLSYLNARSAPLIGELQFTNSTEEIWEDLAGTISVTNGSDIVTGSGTSFTTDLEIGQRLDIAGVIYTVGFIVSDTELELTQTYAGVTGSGISATAELVNTYFWDFGDGTFSTEAEPTHNYSESGSPEVILTVTNKNGTNSYAQTIDVSLIDFYAIDLVNHRVGMFAFGIDKTPKIVKSIGSFGNGRGQFNSLRDLMIVGKGRKTLGGVEV